MRTPRERSWIPILSMTSIAALIALLLMAGGGARALAAESYFGTVAIIDADAGAEVIVDGEPQVCSFSFDFDLGITADVVGWEVRAWSESPFDGAVVLEGQGGPTDASGRVHLPASGALTVANGHYNVVWDDEVPVDASAGVRSFVVACGEDEAPPPTPTQPTPTSTQFGQPGGGTQPTPEASNLDLGAGGGGTTGLTPPPTDAGATVTDRHDSSGLLAVLIAVASFLVVLFTTSRERLSRTR